LKKQIYSKPGVLGIGVCDRNTFNVYVESEEVIETLPTIFNHEKHQYLLYFKVCQGRIRACDPT